MVIESATDSILISSEEDTAILWRILGCLHTCVDREMAEELWRYVEHDGKTWNYCTSCGLLELWAGGMRCDIRIGDPLEELARKRDWILCPRCEGQQYDKLNCRLCRNWGYLGSDGEHI